MTDTTRLDDLFRRLRALAHHDTASRIFGASMHRWTVYTLNDDELRDAGTRHSAALPESYRWWIGTGPGAGVGPFYGLQHPLDSAPGEGPLEGAIPLSDHGCGYADYLMTRGEHAGRVFVDFREGGGDLAEWYPSFEDWIDAWLVRSYAEWGIEYLNASVPASAKETFLREVEDVLVRLDPGSSDPMLAQYPLPLDKRRIALGTLHLGAGRVDAAGVAFARAAEVSREPEAVRAIGACAIAKANGDATSWLACADEGLADRSLFWTSEKRLLVHRAEALERLGRHIECIAAWGACVKHDPNDPELVRELERVRGPSV